MCVPLLRALLVQDYGFFRRINMWPPFVTIGVYCASLSAAMSSLIGASRILHALALDQLFGERGNQPVRLRQEGRGHLPSEAEPQIQNLLHVC